MKVFTILVLPLLFSQTGLASQSMVSSPQVGIDVGRGAFEKLKRSLTTRFKIPFQYLGLPEVEISSTDCKIEMLDVSRYGDIIHLRITRGNDILYFNTNSERNQDFSISQDTFTHKTYKEDCEEQGCIGPAYADSELTVGQKILAVTQVSAYSHQLSKIICTLGERQ